MSIATENAPAATSGQTYKVIVLDDLAAEGLAKLDAAPNIQYDIRTKLAGEELRAALADYDGAVCRSGVKITAESLEGNTKLKAIVRARSPSSLVKPIRHWGITHLISTHWPGWTRSSC